MQFTAGETMLPGNKHQCSKCPKVPKGVHLQSSTCPASFLTTSGVFLWWLTLQYLTMAEPITVVQAGSVISYSVTS